MTALLEVRGLTRTFGALTALGNVSFSVREGELLGLIGPNGAGKSTLYNLIAGALAPTSGDILFQGRRVTAWKPYQAARAGLARTFQIPKPYRHISVIENVALSALLHERTVSGARESAAAVLADVGLTDYAEAPVGILTVGLLKRLEVARALALRPKLVLFDEIMAGLTPSEVRGMTALVAGLPARGITVIWVEHVLYAIMNAAPRIMVLDRGELIADGPPEQLAKDPAVIKAYLGEEMDLLSVEKLNAFYGPVQILHDIDLTVESGQIVALVGANAAGKSTLMYSLAGLRTTCTGLCRIDAERIDGLPPYERVARGLVLVPERRRLFPFMTVLENLEIGAYGAAARSVRHATLEQVYALLPLLAERHGQNAGSLSGGEQQMLALGRALMAKPRVLLLDEPTEGLAPRYVGLLYRVIQDLRRQGHTILIVEQSVHHVLRIADRAYVLENGHIVMQGAGRDLLDDERLKVAYLGLESMITDIHCHFIPDDYFAFVQKHEAFAVRVGAAKGDGIDLERRGAHFGLNRTFFEPALQIARMDSLGIDRSVISLATPLVDYYVEPKLAVAAAQKCNDGFAGLIATAPQRFAAWAFLPMQDPAAAAAELRRCVRDHGFIGGHVATNVRGTYLADESFRIIFDTAKELDVPLFLHPVDPPGRDRTGDYELTVVAGYLFDSTINILRLICSNFLDRYGGMKLVCAHTGAFALMLRNRMQREVDTNAVLSRTLPRKVGDYLRHLYFDTVCFEPQYLRFATSVVPVEQLLLGSDAPFPLGEPDPVNFVRRALPAAQAELALGANYRRLTGH